MASISEDFDAIRTGGPMLGAGGQVRRTLASRWIDVTRRLPPLRDMPGSFSVRVLVRVEEHDGSCRVAVDTYTGQRWGWSGNADRVTHWQPMPPTELGSVTASACPHCGGRWTAIGEKSPPPVTGLGAFSGRVLVRTRDHDGTIRVKTDQYCGTLSTWLKYSDRVTHWRPCPSPELGP